MEMKIELKATDFEDVINMINHLGEEYWYGKDKRVLNVTMVDDNKTINATIEFKTTKEEE